MIDFSGALESVTASPEQNKEDRESLYSAVLSNPAVMRGIVVMSQRIAQKTAAIMMGGFGDEKELIDSFSNRGVSGPLLEVVYLGYLVGKAVGEAGAMEKLLLGPSDSNETS
jgi:hypothetical protein